MLVISQLSLTVLDTRSDVVRPSVRIGRREIEVKRTSWRVVREVRVHRRDFTSVRRHATSRLTGLDITPDQRRHIPLVVQETRVEVRVLIWIGRVDMDPATRERVFLQFVRASAPTL